MRWLLTILQLLVALASAFNIIRFRLDNLLLERAAELDRLTLAGLAVAAVSTAAVLVLCWRVTALTPPRAGLGLVLIGLTALCGVVPGMIESRVRAVEQATRKAEQQQRDDAFARELFQWTADVDRRAAAAQPLEPAQAWAFLDCIATAGYRDEGANPPSSQALELLRRALAAGLIDVNAVVPGHHLNERRRGRCSCSFTRSASRRCGTRWRDRTGRSCACSPLVAPISRYPTRRRSSRTLQRLWCLDRRGSSA